MAPIHRIAIAATLGLAAIWPAAAQAAQFDTTLASRVGVFGPKGNGASNSAVLSADGRFVAFFSAAPNLSPDDGDAAIDAYVRDLENGTLLLVGRGNGPNGAKANGPTGPTSLSADGRYVALDTNASNLTGDDPDVVRDVVVRDLEQNVNILVSRATGAGGAKGNANSVDPALSADGRFVVFGSTATNLSPDDPDSFTDIYVRDLALNTTTLVSRATGGAKGNSGFINSAISADGRFVTFETTATNFDPSDTDGVQDVYVRDLQQNTTTLVSRATGANGAKGNALSVNAEVSADGRFVAFRSNASNLSPDDGDSSGDVYVRDLQQNTTTLVSRATGAAGAKGNGLSAVPDVSSNGRFVVFRSAATNLAADDGDATQDIFVRDLEQNTTTLASRASGATGAKGNGDSTVPTISGDGRFVAFESGATSLSGDDPDVILDVFTRDLLGPPAPAPLPAGPQGPEGSPGPAGAAGPPGRDGRDGTDGAPAFRLFAVISQARLTAKAGKRVKVPYVATTAGRVKLEVRKGRKLTASVNGTTRAGRNTLAWNGRAGRRAAAAGSYTLTLTVTSADGQTASDKARLTLRRR